MDTIFILPLLPLCFRAFAPAAFMRKAIKSIFSPDKTTLRRGFVRSFFAVQKIPMFQISIAEKILLLRYRYITITSEKRDN